MERNKKSVLVLYNQMGEDDYEKLRTMDRAFLNFKPSYNIEVATMSEE